MNKLQSAPANPTLVDATGLDHCHARAADHANLTLADDAITGLRQALAGQFLSDAELDASLGLPTAP
jgi:hypothetical protein